MDKKGYLTFPDFQRFVKLIKVRPELNRLYKKLCASGSSGLFDFAVFESFMRDCQKVRRWSFGERFEVLTPISPFLFSQV